MSIAPFKSVPRPTRGLTVNCDQSNELFDINTFYLGHRNLQISVTRTDAPSGWEKDLLVTLGGGNEIRVGPSDQNTKTIYIKTDFDIAPMACDYVQKIPKLIFQTCHPDRLREPLMDNTIQSIKLKNPEYRHSLFSDEQCASFLAKCFPKRVNQAWDMLQVAAYRADLWRYCILYEFGGVYIDCKMIEHTSLSNVIPPSAEIVLVKDIEHSWLYQAFLACVPKHPLLRAAIETTVSNVLSQNYGDNPLSISGPAMLGAVYNQARNCQINAPIPESGNVFANVMPNEAINRGAIDQSHRANREIPEWMWTFVVSQNQLLFSKCYPGYYNTSCSKHYSTCWAERNVFQGY